MKFTRFLLDNMVPRSRIYICVVGRVFDIIDMKIDTKVNSMVSSFVYTGIVAIIKHVTMITVLTFIFLIEWHLLLITVNIRYFHTILLSKHYQCKIKNMVFTSDDDDVFHGNIGVKELVIAEHVIGVQKRVIARYRLLIKWCNTLIIQIQMCLLVVSSKEKPRVQLVLYQVFRRFDPLPIMLLLVTRAEMLGITE
ncbi:hypothetical protein BDA99DRAFT_544583 [Phascolomyces articulosus]|uniref:Uncharacterized protein n=1 Tax=Phascolomyces articulosus TaxID=60185 RepID=A0AAD5P6N5_9FUNG|nr:hypothetical protein BDA99DRAFT_544583 [Phascolomyces articulosus]